MTRPENKKPLVCMKNYVVIKYVKNKLTFDNVIFKPKQP